MNTNLFKVLTKGTTGTKGSLRPTGFTLIELLITVAIIGVLTSVVIASINTVRKKARDIKRLSEVRETVTALNLYHTDQSAYPIALTVITLDNRGLGSDSTAWTAPNVAPTGKIYLNNLPPSPLPIDGTCSATQNRYRYISASTQVFSLTFCLGSPTGGYKDTNGDGRLVGTVTEDGITVQ